MKRRIYIMPRSARASWVILAEKEKGVFTTLLLENKKIVYLDQTGLKTKKYYVLDVVCENSFYFHGQISKILAFTHITREGEEEIFMSFGREIKNKFISIVTPINHPLYRVTGNSREDKIAYMRKLAGDLFNKIITTRGDDKVLPFIFGKNVAEKEKIRRFLCSLDPEKIGANEKNVIKKLLLEDDSILLDMYLEKKGLLT